MIGHDGKNLFEPFGVLSYIDQLAGGDVTKWEEVSRLENSVALTKMQMLAAEAHYRNNLENSYRNGNDS